MPVFPNDSAPMPAIANPQVYAAVIQGLGLHSKQDACHLAGITVRQLDAAWGKGRRARAKLEQAGPGAKPKDVLTRRERWYMRLEDNLNKASAQVVAALERSVLKEAMGYECEVVVARDTQGRVTQTRTMRVAADGRLGLQLLKVLRPERHNAKPPEPEPDAGGTVVEYNFEQVGSDVLLQIGGLDG